MPGHWFDCSAAHGAVVTVGMTGTGLIIYSHPVNKQYNKEKMTDIYIRKHACTCVTIFKSIKQFIFFKSGAYKVHSFLVLDSMVFFYISTNGYLCVTDSKNQSHRYDGPD